MAGLGLAELELGLPRFVSHRFYAVFAWSGSAQLGFAELGLSRLGWPLLGSARPGLGWLGFARALLLCCLRLSSASISSTVEVQGLPALLT